MNKKQELTLSIVAIIIAVIVLIFGDNIYYQITGKTIGEMVSGPTDTIVEPLQDNPDEKGVISISGIYDDFEIETINNLVNSSLWNLFDESENSCLISQSNGILEVKPISPLTDSGCFLSKTAHNSTDIYPETWEMKVKITDDYKSNCCGSVGIVFYSDHFSEGGGWIECALHPDAYNNAAVIKLSHNNGEDEYSSRIYTSFGEWHILRLSIDRENFEFTCQIDNSIVGSVIPSDKEVLKDSFFSQYIQFKWVPNTTGAYQIDDVKMFSSKNNN